MHTYNPITAMSEALRKAFAGNQIEPEPEIVRLPAHAVSLDESQRQALAGIHRMFATKRD